MSDHDTPSETFILATRTCENSQYQPRHVNLAFDKLHIPMFKVVPPTIGSFIDLECMFRIDAIKYGKDGKIILYATAHF
jgi:hypothetical protein